MGVPARVTDGCAGARPCSAARRQRPVRTREGQDHAGLSGGNRAACPSLLLLPLGSLLVPGSPESGAGRVRVGWAPQRLETGRERQRRRRAEPAGHSDRTGTQCLPYVGNIDTRSLWRAASTNPVTQPAERAAEQKRRLSEAGGGADNFPAGHGVSGSRSCLGAGTAPYEG